MALITVKDLSFTYPNSDKKALSDISLTIEKGEFITLMGATGSGKSTLLRLLKPELRQNGDISGEVLFNDRQTETLSPRESAEKIGYVAQNPEEQIVTDKVWHELAFTLENLGARRSDIARRVAETAAYFGISDRMERDTATLSGGEKQLLNLAAVMTADPELLLLDEPTAQLDPIAAARFIETVYRLNRETGVTVLICEHRAEELFAISDRVVILDDGQIKYDAAPRQVAAQIDINSPHEAFLPTAARIAHLVYQSSDAFGSLYQKAPNDIPLNIREGQRFIGQFANTVRVLDDESSAHPDAVALSLKNIHFRYERNSPDILRDLSLTVYGGEVFALLGANGAGKSTAAAVIAGLRKPYSGTVKLFDKPLKDYKNGSLYQNNLSLLPQDTESVFIRETVGEELKGCETIVESFPYDLRPLYSRHPYDISGGERQLAALCKALSTGPRLLIMDEPSKGLDNHAKTLLRDIILRLKSDGVTVLLITHDTEFAALCADRCALFAQGNIAAVDTTENFMSGNRFYTTAASRITRQRYDGAYTADRAARLIRLNGGAP
ncbi:MAG: ATP-binding cassette domain-containing protein [Ruminococcus sp.]|uniref:ABC transporter ATP-binding protein n=1 Tax=Ruminococcus sp. TaxID=41978 RepID=UPI002873948B|nr:ATP-binding cassette domain-containing protein [Ruminococcus sp.]MBQ3285136.1 ATP-binding cassette domain-containing protein [Ruminococcus sp.]